MVEETYVIVGLGNPGADYEYTRHNMGFTIVDALLRREGETLQLNKWEAQYCRVALWGARVFVVKPLSFMNLSGKSVARFVDYFDVQESHVLVIHDDIDMHPGRVKLVSGGGPGGHNGIRSLIQCLGTKEFFRLKYGVGRPGKNGVHPDMPVDRYVLAPLSNDEDLLLTERMEPLLQGIESFVTSGPQQAMNFLNAIK